MLLLLKINLLLTTLENRLTLLQIFVDKFFYFFAGKFIQNSLKKFIFKIEFFFEFLGKCSFIYKQGWKHP